MDSPESYLGVPVPDILKPNWGTVEASWWRMGVRHGLLGGAQLIRDSDELRSYTDDHMSDMNEAADFLARKVNP